MNNLPFASGESSPELMHSLFGDDKYYSCHLIPRTEMLLASIQVFPGLRFFQLHCILAYLEFLVMNNVSVGMITKHISALKAQFIIYGLPFY